MPDKNQYDLKADDDALQIGHMSGGAVHLPFVAKLGPWGFLAVAVTVAGLVIAKIMVVALLVFDDDSGGTVGAIPSMEPNVAPINTSNLVAAPAPTTAPPANTSCPFRATAVWLQVPDFYYGPFFYTDGTGYFIGFNSAGIVAANTLTGLDTEYPHPASFGGLNQWLTLTGNEPVIVCVDSTGNVFADFG